MESMDYETRTKGQKETWELLFAAQKTKILQCVVDLHIADIIKSHGGQSTLQQIAMNINSSCPDVNAVERIMRYCVRENIFSIATQQQSNSGEPETLYELTRVSRWLLHDNTSLSLTQAMPLFTTQRHLSMYDCLSQSIKEGGKGGSAFMIAHDGQGILDIASQDAEFNKDFNDAMSCISNVVIEAFIGGYKEGFSNLKSLVDVGGGKGTTISEIVKSYPHIQGINFDLPHVIAAAPSYDGITHMQGNMFEDAIPQADAILMKTVLHNWSDKDCIKILQNCRESLLDKKGKLIIVDIVLQLKGNRLFDDTAIQFDVMMMAAYYAGKERTEHEWKNLLKQGGFTRYNIIEIPTTLSIIEAFPN